MANTKHSSTHLHWAGRSIAGFCSAATLLLSGSAGAVELFSDLTVCADRTMASIKVIEVAYEGVDAAPCYTYLSSEKRQSATPTSTEQVAWSPRAERVCQLKAQTIQRALENQGYRCITHREDRGVVAARLAANRPPPIIITMVGDPPERLYASQDPAFED